jgi:protein-S-isoprenylcysteine O-methyltransferase Ste14
MSDLIAVMTIMAWPIIPLFWIPVHLSPAFFRKIKITAYLLPLIPWLPLAYLIYRNSTYLLQDKIEFPIIIVRTGWILLITGSVLHLWTGKLLSLYGLIGVPEIFEKKEGRLVKTGAFSFVRHPTYLAHTLMFSGVFLFSGSITVGALTAVDFIVVHLLIIPFEEKELLLRYGAQYGQYQKEVPKFFPRFRGSRIK